MRSPAGSSPRSCGDADRQENQKVLCDKLHHRPRNELPEVGPLVAREPAHTRRYFGFDDDVGRAQMG